MIRHYKHWTHTVLSQYFKEQLFSITSICCDNTSIHFLFSPTIHQCSQHFSYGSRLRLTSSSKPDNQDNSKQFFCNDVCGMPLFIFFSVTYHLFLINFRPHSEQIFINCNKEMKWAKEYLSCLQEGNSLKL